MGVRGGERAIMGIMCISLEGVEAVGLFLCCVSEIYRFHCIVFAQFFLRLLSELVIRARHQGSRPNIRHFNTHASLKTL